MYYQLYIFASFINSYKHRLFFYFLLKIKNIALIRFASIPCIEVNRGHILDSK